MATFDGVGYPSILPLDSLGDGPTAIDQPDGLTFAYRTPSLDCDTKTSNLPQVEPHASFGGEITETFSYVYYNRIHVFPQPLDFGAVLSPVIRFVQVWNAFTELSKQLDSVTPFNLAGVAIDTGPLPRTFAPLEAVLFEMTADLDGPPVINGKETFQFAGLPPLDLLVIGTRAFIWSLRHNWEQEPSEKIEFRTNFFRGLSGSEQRTGTRTKARRKVTLSYLANGQFQKAMAARRFYVGQAFAFSVPMWQDATVLLNNVSPGGNLLSLDTRGRDFDLGGTILIWRNDGRFEAPTIGAIDNSSIQLLGGTVLDWRIGDYVVPVRRCFLPEDFTWEWITDELDTFTIEWEVASSEEMVRRFNPAVGLPIYRGLPVWERATSYNDNIAQSQTRRIVRYDNEIGVTGILPIENLPSPGFAYEAFARDRAAFRDYLGILMALKGAKKTLWLPSYMNDFKLSESILPGDVAIKCLDWQFFEHYTDNGTLKDNRRDICIVLLDGTHIKRRINSMSKTAGSTETFTLDSAVGLNIAPADVRYICFLRRARIASDEIPISFKTDQVATFILKFVELTTTP